MPRKFDFRKDFSQLDIKKVTKDEMYQAITNEQIQALLDTACQGFKVDLKEVEIPSTSNYRSEIGFESYEVEMSELGVLSCFLADDDYVQISGSITAVADVNPYYSAIVRCHQGYSRMGENKKYLLRYGSDRWEYKK